MQHGSQQAGIYGKLLENKFTVQLSCASSPEQNQMVSNLVLTSPANLLTLRI